MKGCSLWVVGWLVLVLGTAGCHLGRATPTPEPRPTLPLATLPPAIDPRDLAEFHPTELAFAERGRAVYQRLCVECHGDGGQGDGPTARTLRIKPGDFTDRATRSAVPPSWYYRAISKGVVGSAMLSWENQLNTQQRWDVTFYTWSLASTPASIARGRELYARECAGCHGDRGLGDGPRAATLDQAPTPLSDPRYLAGRTGEELFDAISGRQAPPAHDWSSTFSPTDRWAIVDFLWTFLYTP